MKLQTLNIRRAALYETDPGMLVGTIHLSSEHGEQIINLSPGGISALLKTIQAEVKDSARRSAETAATSITEAIDGCLLLQSDGQVTL
jgi:hypothetical protein